MESVKSDNKRIAKNTLYLYARMLLVMVVTLYTSRLVLEALGVEDYGIYNVVGGVVSMFSIITGSLTSAISRFFTFELGKKDFIKLQRIFSTSLSIQLLIILLVFTLLEILGVWFLNHKMTIPSDRINAANWVFQTSIAAFLFGLFKIPFNAAIIAHERMAAFAYLGIMEVILKWLIAEILLRSQIDNLILYANLQLFLSIILGLSYITYCVKNLDGCALIIRIDKAIFKSMLIYSSWSFMGTVAYTCYNYGYNILLNLFFDPVVNAARGISVQVQHAVESFSNNFQASMNPQIIKNYSAGNIERMHSLVLNSSKYSFFLIFFLVLPLVIEAEMVLNLWLTVVPPHTVNFVRLILVTITISCLSGPMIASCQATGHIKKFEIIIGTIMTLSLPICYVSLYWGGMPESLFYIYLLFTIAALFVRCLIVLPLIGLNWKCYLKNVIARIVAVVCFSVPLPILIYLLSEQSTFVSFLGVVISSLISVSTSVYFIGMKKNERIFIFTKLLILRNKLRRYN